jgi:hypothetical protein
VDKAAAWERRVGPGCNPAFPHKALTAAFFVSDGPGEGPAFFLHRVSCYFALIMANKGRFNLRYSYISPIRKTLNPVPGPGFFLKNKISSRHRRA